MHTGGDLSLPEEVRAQVQPNPMPVVGALSAGAEDAPADDGDTA